MKHRVKLSSQAKEDIARLADILAPYPSKAGRLFKEMENKLDLLEDNPYIIEGILG